MKQLTGLDASFLYMETPSTFGHVNGLGIYKRPSPDFDPFEEVYKRFGAMVGHLEPMRRRLVEVPFGLDHPWWIDDPDFDLDYHVRHIGLAPPGAADQLAEQVSRIVGRPMDRSHPLWEAYVIEGLADDRWALLSKTHHATIDGASGVIFLNMLTDSSPTAVPEYEPIEWKGEEMPSDLELISRATRTLVTNPVKGMRFQLRLMQNVADAAGVASVSDAAGQAANALKSAVGRGDDRAENERQVSVPLTPAPATPWNKAITAHRRFAMRSVALENLKVLKTATGGTLNDVVMAICAGALREYLIKHDALPDEPLRAMVPVSIRTGEEDDIWTNLVSGLVADLPTNCDDPIERVRLCKEAMNEAKKNFELIPADTMLNAAQFASPILAASATRLAARLRIADRVSMPANVVISNVPGPRSPLYLAGAELDAFIPVSTIADGMGLNITVHSYVDRMDFGLIAARDLIPDLWDMVDMHVNEVERLFEATGAEWAVPQAPPAMRRGSLDGSVKPVARRTPAPSTATTKKAARATPPKKSARAEKSTTKKRAAKAKS